MKKDWTHGVGYVTLFRQWAPGLVFIALAPLAFARVLPPKLWFGAAGLTARILGNK